MPCSVTSIFLTISGRGGFCIAVLLVETRPPNSVMSAVVPIGWDPRGLMLRMWTQSVSPFSAPRTEMGPHWGLRNGMWSSSDGLSFSLLIAPSNASCVSTTTTSPGSTVNRVGIGAVDVVIFALLFDRQLMRALSDKKRTGPRVVIASRDEQPVQIFQQFTGGHPPGRNDVRAIPAVAAQCRGSLGRARDRHQSLDGPVLVEPIWPASSHCHAKSASGL